MRTFLFTENKESADQCPGKRSQNQGKECLLPAQIGTDHQHHCHIAHAQSLFFPQQVIETVNKQERSCSRQSTDQGLVQAQVFTEKGVDESQRYPGKGYLIGNDLVVKVDNTQDDQCTGKKTGGKEKEAQ